VLAGLSGTRSATVESTGGETWLSFEPDAAAMARLHVDPEVVRATVDLFTTGGQLGELDQEGQRLRVRIAPEPLDVLPRGPADQLRDLTVRSSDGQPVPLALLGRVAYSDRPALLRTERGELVTYVHVDLADGADLEQYIEAARSLVGRALASGAIVLRDGERIDWAGQYQLLLDGRSRLTWIVPLVAISMLALLWLQFRDLTEALLVLASVPFALVGSFWTLYLLGYPLSAPVWVGLLSVVGLAMQTGVVMVVYIDDAFRRRLQAGLIRDRDDIVAAHAEGTVQRLRPKIMTITTMAASLLPLLWADGAGAEIMRRVAAPMLGGLLSSAFLTLEVLPVLYTIWRYRQLQRARRDGIAIELVVNRRAGF
jgi:Cu(I)/Ag(I) efflux system membrane protein CusA/SilA